MKENNIEKEYIKILLVFIVGFNLLSFLLKTPMLSYIGTGVGVVGLISPFLGKLFAKGWMKLAHILGKINGSILLTIIFFIFLFPIALLQRIISRKDHLQLKKPTSSNFKTREKIYKKEDLDKMW